MGVTCGDICWGGTGWEDGCWVEMYVYTLKTRHNDSLANSLSCVSL